MWRTTHRLVPGNCACCQCGVIAVVAVVLMHLDSTSVTMPWLKPSILWLQTSMQGSRRYVDNFQMLQVSFTRQAVVRPGCDSRCCQIRQIHLIAQYTEAAAALVAQCLLLGRVEHLMQDWLFVDRFLPAATGGQYMHQRVPVPMRHF